MEALKDLEDKIRAAGEQLATLRKQNSGLKSKVKKLEAELSTSSEAGDWQGERDQIRDRLTKLTADLEALL